MGRASTPDRPSSVETRQLLAISSSLCRPGVFRDAASGLARQPVALLDGVSLTLASAAGPVEILRDVSLAIEPGEAVALIGPSGSGKSSLLMVLGGLERPTAGRIAVAGQELAGLDEDDLARLRRRSIGIVLQSFHLLPTMTALENVAVPLELAGRRNAAEAAGRRSAGSDWPTAPVIIPDSCPAANSSGWRSPGP